MESNFDFLKNIDKSLYEIIIDTERLFRDEYFNQAIINTRIFAETLAKKIYGTSESTMTFDDVLNCLKDTIETEREKEFIEDLFFIKQEGNKCAHGEDAKSTDALEVIKRAFEISISYGNKIKKTNNFDKLEFDFDLLITQKKKEKKLINEYLKRADKNYENEENKETLLKDKESDFLNKAKKDNTAPLKDKNKVKSIDSYRKNKKETQKRIKEKIKVAKTDLKNTINKKPKKNKKTKKIKNNNLAFKKILFIIFVIISLFLIFKMIL